MLDFFGKRIKVTFINNSTGKLLGISKLKLEQLPETFNKPTTMQLEGKDWKVIKADPVNASDFGSTKVLTLHLGEIGHLNLKNVRFSIPTLSNELPMTGENKLFHDFILELHEDDWRQVEFLPIQLLPVIQDEMKSVEAILFPDDESTNLLGYGTIHVRAKLGGDHLSIPLLDFCKLVDIREKGALMLTGHSGFVKNGFALRTDNYIYYGQIEGEMIRGLCVKQFDSADDELLNVCSTYGLVLINWCRGEIATA